VVAVVEMLGEVLRVVLGLPMQLDLLVDPAVVEVEDLEEDQEFREKDFQVLREQKVITLQTELEVVAVVVPLAQVIILFQI
jgi:hypothetical protein